jgi:pyrimidine-specific ribonucleoside hydrolase
MDPGKLDVIFEMETNDPDDFLTLLLLLGHPRVNLKAVTLVPGSAQQVGLVRRALGWFGVELPVGASRLDHEKPCVSAWHERAYGRWEPSWDAEPGGALLARLCDERTTLLTGAPPKNLSAALEVENFKLGRWVAQGGFAGEGVVPAERQLAQFRGLRECPSFNLNGDPKGVLRALRDPRIEERRFVSKNVCHGVVYDAGLHARIGPLRAGSRSLDLIWRGMDAYLSRSPEGKKFHDPLAACCAIEPSLASWAAVEVYRAKGGWGSVLAPGSGTWIIHDHDPAAFERVLTEGAA